MTFCRLHVVVPVLLAAASAIAPRMAFAGDPPGGVSALQAAAVDQKTNSSGAAPAPKIDDAAMALLQKSQAALWGLKTYHAESVMTMKIESGADGKVGAPSTTLTTLTVSKPNLMRFESFTMPARSLAVPAKKPDLPGLAIVSDGKNLITQSGKTYRTTSLKSLAQLPAAGGTLDGFFRSEGSLFSQVEAAKKASQLVAVRTAGSETVNGVDCRKVLIDTKIHDSNDFEIKETYYFDPDNLVRRMTSAVTSKQLNYTTDLTVTSLKTDEPVADAATLFAYTPPAGVTLYVAPPTPVLLANGVAAPDFTAVDSTGAKVKLSDFRGKVVVVDFWASWCPPCKASMPHNQEITKKLQASNVPMVLLAVDNSEDQPAFAKWVKEHPELASLKFVYTDPKTHNVCNDDYHVSGIPTQYVIDPDGIIRASFVGYGGPTDDLENAVRAAIVKTASK